MLIRVRGARGSFPVSGKRFSRYGGDTTCLEILSENGIRLVIDAGTGLRSLSREIKDPDQGSDLHWLFTHFHWDHVLGFPYYLPFLTSRYDISLHSLEPVQAGMLQHLNALMVPPFFPLSFDLFMDHLTFRRQDLAGFCVDSIRIDPILLSHPNGGLGYRFTEGGRVFVFLTDNELGYEHPGGRTFSDYAAFCSGADLLIHDAEYTTPEYRRTRSWGHSTVEQTLRLALEAGVKALGLFHHNRDRSDDDIEALVSGCSKRLQDQNSSIECFAVAQDAEYRI